MGGQAGVAVPRVGMLATVRNRRGVVSAVEAVQEGETSALLHLVTVEFADAEGSAQESILWEREQAPVALEPNALPAVEDQCPMQAPEFLALQRAARWSALTPFLSAQSIAQRAEPAPTAPMHGAVSVDDFQLVPLARAMRMPRIALLLADDVGLGKTIEAGLILAELIRQRRIRRVLIMTPAALRTQWQQEMAQKFALDFDIVDRDFTHRLQRDLGLDANPWRALHRIITSYHYLRQPDVLEQFIATCNVEGEAQGAQLPWDLLIVDEAHNLMPSNFGDDSALAQMLRRLSPQFEHRLFLTATPHNGYTGCFSGLLEQLDPVRFTQKPRLEEQEKRMLDQVLIRRLKSDINQQDAAAGRPPRFATRQLEPLRLSLGEQEQALSLAVRNLCSSLKGLVGGGSQASMVLNFAIEVLRKRLLSCPAAFADTWLRFKAGMAESERRADAEVLAARRASIDDLDDDLERESRGQHAARTVGAWLLPYAKALGPQLAAVDAALLSLRLDQQPVAECVPAADSRFAAVLELINKRLQDGGKWRQDERLIIFTEYKTTLDYLIYRLGREFKAADGAIAQLYGGMEDREREAIKQAFNATDSPVRILVATDAASEGLNLQHSARLLAHYDIPWNPARLEQRNGRIDRHGQARDVQIHHFTSDDDADLEFVARLLHKVNEIREDLGSVGELFDSAFQRRMLELDEGQAVLSLLDERIAGTRGATEEARVKTSARGEDEKQRLQSLMADLDLSPETLRETLAVAMGLGTASKVYEGPDARGRLRLRTPLPPRWQSVVDDHLRLPPGKGGSSGALPGLVFDSQFFIDDSAERPVFRPSPDTVLLHLGHPVLRQSLNTLARLRLPGSIDDAPPLSRWLVTEGQAPKGAQALLLLTVEEIAINDLRETFHHWVRTLALPVQGASLGKPLPYQGPHQGASPARPASDRLQEARQLWDGVQEAVKALINSHKQALSAQIQQELQRARDEATAKEKQSFDQRLREVAALQKTQSINRLEKELADHKARALQFNLLEDAQAEWDKRQRDLAEELKRRQAQFGGLQERLTTERERILKHVLPKRFALRDQAQVFPVTIELRLPEARA